MFLGRLTNIKQAKERETKNKRPMTDNRIIQDDQTRPWHKKEEMVSCRENIRRGKTDIKNKKK